MKARTSNVYDTDHVFPFGYRDLLPYYEWVEHTLPVATAPMGLKEEIFFRGALQLGFSLETTKDITRVAFRPQQNAILQPTGNAGRTRRSTTAWCSRALKDARSVATARRAVSSRCMRRSI